MIQRILIDSSVRDESVTQRVLANRGSIPVEWVDKETAKRTIEQVPLSQGKRLLYLTRFPGGMVKSCPGTASPYLCCRYFVINQILQCPMDCTYCILQDYLEEPAVTLHTNVDDAFKQIDGLLLEQPNRLFRFGTGELGDSLAIDALAGLSEPYADFFSKKKNAVMEFKTKTDRVDGLLRFQPKNAVVSWSLNPQSVIATEESGSSSLEDRLRAAARCQEKGYVLGFHFDPICDFKGWEEEYEGVVRQLFEHVDASRIAWISLGTLRFPPSLKGTIEERFPGSRVVYQEMVRGLDGKMRYPRPRRIELYRRLYALLTERRPDLFLYLCMEHPPVWDAVFDRHPESNAELDFWFAQNVYFRFPELNATKPIRDFYHDETENKQSRDSGIGDRE